MGTLSRFRPPQRRTETPLGQILHAARARPRWAETPIPRDTLEQLHALLSVGPSMVDASPTQVLFLTSRDAKARLARHLGRGVGAGTLAAPAFAIVGYDVDFAEQLVDFLPHVAGAPSCFDRPEIVRQTAIRNGTLQGAYLIVAARTLGLEASPLADFSPQDVSSEFFRGGRVQATFVCGLGFSKTSD
jgi:3-hydroxypropanoate dehydrogenase